MQFRGMLVALAFMSATACVPTVFSAAVVTRPAEAVISRPTARAEWSSATAIAALRAALRTQPFGEDAVEGTMVVVAEADVAHRATGQVVAIDLAIDWWPNGAVLIETGVGRWWVWPGGNVAPADRTAATIATRMPSAPTLQYVVDWR
jgi:hypothetical protein